MSSEAAVTAMPRRGRVWVILLLTVAVVSLGYALFNIATQKPGGAVVRISGISSAQEIFGGVPQEGDRVGSSDAPVSIQVFADLQCGNCSEQFLSTIPSLVTNYARPGDVQLLMRHYSVAENPVEAGFLGAEAAAKQGYGWQYTYLFFRNQDEAERFNVSDDFLSSIAGSIGELEVLEWEKAMQDEVGTGGPITTTLQGYEKLGFDLGIRARPADIVSGPDGTRTLQDAPSLARIERAIAEVDGS